MKAISREKERKELGEASRTLKDLGLLLEMDSSFPSLTGQIVGKRNRTPLTGSWWGHPQSTLIWTVLTKLSEDPDVIFTKLISGKVTLVHRKLWKDIISIGESRRAWQMENISSTALELLELLDKRGEIRTDSLSSKWKSRAAKELELALLVEAEQIHTEKGYHARVLRSWKSWVKSKNLSGILPKPEQAMKKLERIVHRINNQYSSNGRLPWVEYTN